ncbi:MAG: AAA family ATPase [Ignavibacteriaceae bacterium]|nr:AAA family ATPase [Ignavibacteriaceae bacterium]
MADSFTFSTLQQEAFDHLLKGRFRLALPIAEKLIQEHRDSADAAVCYSWASLENGDPDKAQKYLDISKQLSGQSLLTQMYRGYVQMRLSSFEAAIYDFNMTEGKQKELLAWTYLNKAKSLTSIGEVDRAVSFYELCLMIDNNANPNWKGLRKYFNTAKKIIKGFDETVKKESLALAREALLQKEYWFSLLTANTLLNVPGPYEPEVHLLQLESMYRMNQIALLKDKLKANENFLKSNERYQELCEAFKKTADKKEEFTKSEFIRDKTQTHDILERHPNEFVEVVKVGLFNATEDAQNASDKNLSQVNFKSRPSIGVNLLLKNLNYNKADTPHNCFYAWFLDDEIIHQSTVSSTIPKDWEMYTLSEFVETCKNPLWTKGIARLEFFINRSRVFTRNFTLADEDTYFSEAEEVSETKADAPVNFAEVFEELNSIIGLTAVKESVRELVDYLEVMNERKQLGLKAQDKISVHAVFLGNPGTGKTTVARLMGKIFKGMGLLPKGEVIEVDRAALVGQYVGETAQKTEKIIEDALGNVLFIDEAYTLVKKGQSNDFGQEAIDVLLKRMEDRKGEFFVIAAGYPDEMKDFLEANPGLKSRFTHNFSFEDYTPDEMMKIFQKMVIDEDYRVTGDAEKLLFKEFTKLYRARDKNFGNARTVRKVFEDAKMQVSKRYLKLAKHERTKEKLTTIIQDDISEIFSSVDDKKRFQVPLNEELLQEANAEVNKLTGLSSVKRDVTELIKLAKFYRDSGEDLSSKFSSHILFLGNPGTGKTTVARIISKIYSALGILPGGQLVETERQGLVAVHVGETAQKTTAMINKAMGGTLFIDEAYTLVKKDGGSDFGQEAIDVLLKRMEDERGKFIVIAAGYTEEMKSFLESNPGLKSRFTKVFTFEDYSPDELMEIFDRMSKSNNVKLDENARNQLMRYFNDLYRNRDKNFGNARLVRNTFESVMRSRNLRLSDTPPGELSEEMKSTITLKDLEEILPKKQSPGEQKVSGDADRLQSLMSELQSLTGLDSVKNEVDRLVNSLKIAQVRKERGMQVIQKPLHSVFLGNPGTGKTTVARLISSLFKELGILERGQLVEVDRAQLVAGYSGQTAIKTDEIIKKAIGGTLFIDEAYTLARGSNDFGQEAIDTLLKRMEDFKGQFIVIVAGYTREMQAFMESNPGLTSRFTNIFTFEDYNSEQLVKITTGMAAANGYKFSQTGLKKLEEKYQGIYSRRDQNFGNARTARNVLMEIITNQEGRISSLLSYTDEELMTLTDSDISL